MRDARDIRSPRLALALAIAALVAAGCLPAAGADNAFYVLIPYAVALVAASLALAAHCGLSFRRSADAAQDLAPAASARSAAGAVAAALAFVGETAHVLVFGSGHFGYASTGPKADSNIWYVLAYLLLVGLSALLLWWAHKMAKSQRRA